MKGILLVFLGFAVLAVLLFSGALNPLMADLAQRLAGDSNPKETTPAESLTPDPTATPQPNRNISIYYSFKTVQSISSQYGPVNPDSDRVFLEAALKIENNGYDLSFTTNPALFGVTANGTNHEVDVLGTGVLSDWGTVNVANGDLFSGTLVFQVPATASSFELTYFQPISLSRFSIVWVEK